MVPRRPVLCAQLALLGCALGWAWPRACSVPDVLRHYRAVIFEDLQAAVRRLGPAAEPGSRHHPPLERTPAGAGRGRGRGRGPGPGAPCRAREEHGILLSIQSLGRTLRRALAGGRRGVLERAAWTVAVRTEAALRRHCRPRRLPCPGGGLGPAPPPAPAPAPASASGARGARGAPGAGSGRGGRRRLLRRALDAVAACWEKLFALRAAAGGAA